MHHQHSVTLLQRNRDPRENGRPRSIEPKVERNESSIHFRSSIHQPDALRLPDSDKPLVGKQVNHVIPFTSIPCELEKQVIPTAPIHSSATPPYHYHQNSLLGFDAGFRQRAQAHHQFSDNSVNSNQAMTQNQKRINNTISYHQLNYNQERCPTTPSLNMTVLPAPKPLRHYSYRTPMELGLQKNDSTLINHISRFSHQSQHTPPILTRKPQVSQFYGTNSCFLDIC